MFWLLIYACLISILLTSTTEIQMKNYEFLHPQWMLTTRQIYWDSTLPMCMMLAQTNDTIGNINLHQMIDELKMSHLNYISTYNMIDFNKKILDYDIDLSETFTSVYYESLCRQTDSDLLNECRSLFNGKLRAGYSVYSKFLLTTKGNSAS